MKIGIIGAGHPFEYQYRALKDLGFTCILCDKDINKINDYPETKVTNYQDLVGLVDAVLISTPPSTHSEIINYFLDKGIFIISEKPLVTKMSELSFLNQTNKFYNILHFSFGLEIEWFIENFKDIKEIVKIEAHIHDPYIVSNHIRDESLSLHGAYLDETINPLSAITKIMKTYPRYIDSKLEYLKHDTYDYKSVSRFKFNNILATINVEWNDFDNRDKYIDIFFNDRIIRLDSMNQSVIDLTNNKILYIGDGVRMYNHYLNGFKDYLKYNTNISEAYYINKAILDYQT